jgi:protoporphyrinogen oxidase
MLGLVDPLADFITRHGGHIHLATAIKSVTPATAGPARITTTAGVTHEADHVIFAVPGYAVPALLPAELRTTSPFAALADLNETPIITITLWYATIALPSKARPLPLYPPVPGALAEKAIKMMARHRELGGD